MLGRVARAAVAAPLRSQPQQWRRFLSAAAQAAPRAAVNDDFPDLPSHPLWDSKVQKESVEDLFKRTGVDPNTPFTFTTPDGGKSVVATPVTEQQALDFVMQVAVDEHLHKIDGKRDAFYNQGYLDAIGLGPFHRKASLLVSGAITALSTEFYVLNEETYVVFCLLAAFTTMHVVLREPILQYYYNKRDEALKRQRDVEEEHIAACEALIRTKTGAGEVAEAVKAAFQEKEELVHLEAKAKARAERLKVSRDFEARLQRAANQKSDEENKAYKALVEKVYDEVLQAAATDAKFKKAALKYAITAIATPEQAGVNPTVELYEAKLKQ